MDPFQLNSAVREVRMLRRAILDKQRLRGFSGRARALGGVVALVAGWGIYVSPWPISEAIALAIWGVVFVGAWVMNYGAVALWHVRQREPLMDGRALWPHLETLPTWVAGGVLTLALWRHGAEDLLYGFWMVLFGLLQTSSRKLLPREIVWVGAYYVAAGTVGLFVPFDFMDAAVVMGTVFFVGELMGGFVFHADGDWRRWWAFWGFRGDREAREHE